MPFTARKKGHYGHTSWKLERRCQNRTCLLPPGRIELLQGSLRFHGVVKGWASPTKQTVPQISKTNPVVVELSRSKQATQLGDTLSLSGHGGVGSWAKLGKAKRDELAWTVERREGRSAATLAASPVDHDEKVTYRFERCAMAQMFRRVVPV